MLLAKWAPVLLVISGIPTVNYIVTYLEENYASMDVMSVLPYFGKSISHERQESLMP